MTAKRTDTNHRYITAVFRALGASVHDTHEVGEGFPDLAVGYADQTVLVEVKDGDKPPSARKLNDREQEWHDGWRGAATIVETERDAINLVRKLREAGL